MNNYFRVLEVEGVSPLVEAGPGYPLYLFADRSKKYAAAILNAGSGVSTR